MRFTFVAGSVHVFSSHHVRNREPGGDNRLLSTGNEFRKSVSMTAAA